MATKIKQHQQQRSPFELRNEGQSVPIVLFREKEKVNFQADLSTLGAPQEVFAADAVDIVRKQDSYRLAFSMSRLYGEGARALVEVVMPTIAARGFAGSLQALNKQDGASSELLPLKAEPTNSVSVLANFARISTNELASILDFYFVSPLSMEHAERTAHVQYRDVVRISTVPTVFYAVVKYFLNAKELFDE